MEVTRGAAGKVKGHFRKQDLPNKGVPSTPLLEFAFPTRRLRESSIAVVLSRS